MEQEMLLPSTIKDLSNPNPFRISMARILLLGLSVTPIALALFLVGTIITDLDASTYTECEAFNVIPSVSSVAKSNQVGWIIISWWSAAFILLTAFLYKRLYRRILPRTVRSLSQILTGSLILHSFSILVWAHFAHINGTHPLHVITVILLWSSACIFLGGSFAIHKYHFSAGRISPKDLDNDSQYSYLLKRKLVFTFVGTFTFMWVWYLLHMEFCPTLEHDKYSRSQQYSIRVIFNLFRCYLFSVYSIFAIFEFVAFWSFLCYLCTAYFDFYNVYICHDKRLGYYLSEFETQ
ncbi:post-GPI attachment to proteins factor 2 [Drosophila tropicalis]|uniref:post-GPI attachment to proteins factor 2 n=1 Tax=Drosophila tropicalis TaxID=46794 RepID=UPI0035AB70CE